MNNYYNDPFYKESSYINADGVNVPGPSQNNMALPGLGGGPIPAGSDIGGSSPSGGNFQNILDKAPEYLNVLGSVVGMVKNFRDSKSQAGTNDIKLACGKKPLVNKAKKQAYAQCVQRVLYPPIQTQTQKNSGNGMSTTTKVIIGVVVLVVLTVITIVIVKVAKSKKS